MKIELERIKNASKDILEDFKHENPDQQMGAKEALGMLIRHFTELEESSPHTFDITWSEEDVEKAFPEIPEDDRGEVLGMFQDALDDSGGVWDRMWECLDIVGEQFIEQNPPTKELKPTEG